MKTNHLTRLAEIYAKHTGLTIGTVGVYAADHSHFFLRVKNEVQTCTIRKANRVIKWFYVNWPKGITWPRDIERPQITASERLTLKRVDKRELARQRKEGKRTA